MLAATCWGKDAPVGDSAPVKENVTIHVQGKITKEHPLDIKLSGIGPRFLYSAPDSSAIFEGTLSRDNDGKLVLDYGIGARVPVKVGNSTELREFGLQGRAIIEYGKVFEIGTVNGNDFILTVTKYGK
ncbi:MAG: hypothetical protein A2794_01450 [Alphaproteobacteria bacterium RIFCSPHIGHO2_01_FULL_40_8]|nr:MAG: hypothetical protein A2794_01450 [Alphaproteobacteria bacterium RIFCSPHIGHO2_01_FULL_40_8]